MYPIFASTKLKISKHDKGKVIQPPFNFSLQIFEQKSRTTLGFDVVTLARDKQIVQIVQRFVQHLLLHGIKKLTKEMMLYIKTIHVQTVKIWGNLTVNGTLLVV